MQFEENRAEAIPPDAEPGMNFISMDFEIVMVNRTNERLYRKPAIALLGKKCYHEFEKADEPCPHCPGRLAVATGEAHQTETVGVRDDGTRFAARIRAHPVTGPDNHPPVSSRSWMTSPRRRGGREPIRAGIQRTWAVLPLTAERAERLSGGDLEAGCESGHDIGCVFLDRHHGEQFARHHTGPDGTVPGGPSAVARVNAERFAGSDVCPERVEVRSPKQARSTCRRSLLVGASTYPEIPPTLQAGLQSLGTAAGHAISRIRAAQSRGDAVADLEALITTTPLATWVLDVDGRITKWNKAAERLLGWKAAEVVGEPSPVGADLTALETAATRPEKPPTTVLPKKDGTPVEGACTTPRPFRLRVGRFLHAIVKGRGPDHASPALADARASREYGDPSPKSQARPPAIFRDALRRLPPCVLISVDSNERLGEGVGGHSPNHWIRCRRDAVRVSASRRHTRTDVRGVKGHPFILARRRPGPFPPDRVVSPNAVLRGLVSEPRDAWRVNADVSGPTSGYGIAASSSVLSMPRRRSWR